MKQECGPIRLVVFPFVLAHLGIMLNYHALKRPCKHKPPLPICSMHGIFTYMWIIFTYMWVIFRTNVGTYSIHGAYGSLDLRLLTYESWIIVSEYRVQQLFKMCMSIWVDYNHITTTSPQMMVFIGKSSPNGLNSGE